MAYEKKTWVDRQVEFPGRRKLTAAGAPDVYDVSRDEGLEIEAGDALNAANLNDLEGRVEEAFGKMGVLPAEIIYTAGSFDIVADLAAGVVRATVMGYTTQPYADGDTMTINGTPVTLTDLTGEPLSGGAWGNDTGLAVPVQLMVDFGAGRAFFSTGGGGGMGAKFLQYTLPSSSTFGNPQEWYFDDSIQFPEEPYCGKVVYNECYLISKTYIFVINLVTGVYVSYTHGLVINDAVLDSPQRDTATFSVVEIWGHVFFKVNHSFSTICRINTTTKIISQEVISGVTPGTLCMSLLGDNGTGYMYLVGGMSDTGNGISTGTGLYSRVYTRSNIGEPWIAIANSGNHAASYGSSSSASAAMSAVGVRKNGKFYVAEFKSGQAADAYPVYRRVFTLDGPNINNGTAWVQPAFVPDSYNLGNKYYSIGGTTLLGNFIGIISTEMKIWNPETNTTHGTLPPAPIKSNNPNAVIAHDDQAELRVYKAGGMRRLYFESPIPPETRAPVLKIYKGQKYHGDKPLEIKHDGVVVHTITEEWQTATKDIEIKRGQYDSAWDYRVYVENK